MEGLLEQVLPGHRGVQNLVGIHDPRAAGRESQSRLGRFLLIPQILLDPVVQLEHHVIVRTASALGDPQRRQEPGLARQGPGHRGEKFPGVGLKGLADPPDPVHPDRVHVREDPEDACAPGGTGREGVRVQPLVVFLVGGLAADDLQRTETGPGLFEKGAVGGQKRLQQPPGHGRVSGHHRMQSLGIRFLHGRALDGIRARVKADILGPAV